MIHFRAAFALLLALGLAGCGGIGTLDKVRTTIATVSEATGAAVTPERIVLARSAFNAAEVLATNYMRLPRCAGGGGPLCRDPALRVRIDGAVHAGRRARNALAAYQRGRVGSMDAPDAYSMLVTATETIQNLTAAYRAARGT